MPLAELVDAFAEVAGAAADVAALDGGDPNGVGARVLAGSDEARLRAERQMETGQGPLLDARSSRSVVAYSAFDVPRLWPDYASLLPAAPAILGVAVAIDVNGAVTSIDITALAGRAEASPESLASLARAFIAVVGIRHRMSQRDARIAHLERALELRTRTEQAKGFIHARSRLAPEEAFEALRRHARRNSAPLADVVGDVLDGRCSVDEIVAADQPRERRGGR